MNTSVGNKKDLAYFFAVLLEMAAMSSTVISTSDTTFAKKSKLAGGNFTTGDRHHSSGSSKGKSLTQIPSEPTDFPDNDQNAIEVHVTSAKKDIIGAYHVRGEIKNVSNDTLQSVQITAHFFDGSGQPVAATTCCYTTLGDIDPGHTSTFDSFAQEQEISGVPHFL
jgi:hypothetical protein